MDINYFGKLPLYADFLKFSPLTQEFNCLDQWFQNGIYLARKKSEATFKEDYRKLPPCKFIFQPEKFSQLVTGTFIAGEDKGGRKFPFIIFTSSKKIDLSGTSSYLSTLNSSFLVPSMQFSLTDWSNSDSTMLMDQFAKWSKTITNTGNPSNCDSLLKKSNTNFWREILGDRDHKKKYLIIQNILDTLQPIKTYDFSSSFPCLKFPLSRKEENNSSQIVFWLTLTQQILGKNVIKPTAIWNNGNEYTSPALYLYFNEPSPHEFLYLLDSALIEDDSPCDMIHIREARCDKVIDKMDPNLIALLDQGNISLKNLLHEMSLLRNH